MTAGFASIRQFVGLSARTLRDPSALTWVGGDQIVVSGSNFLTGVIVARTLGIAGFGVFSLLWLGVLFLQNLQSALLLSPMMSIGPKQTAGEETGYFSAIAFHQLLFSALACALVLSLWTIDRAFALDWMAPKTIAAWGFCIFAVQIHEFLRRYNFTIQKSRTVFLSDVVRNVLQLVVLIGLLLRYPDVGVTGVLLAIAACAVLGTIAIIDSLPSLRLNVTQTVAVAVRHANFSKWLVGSFFLQWLTGSLFVIAAGALLGPVAVGALKAAQNLIAVTHIFFFAADNVLPARAARIFHASGRPALDRFVHRLMLLGCVGTGLVGLVFAIPARQWLTLLFGASYADYGYVVAGYAVIYTLIACAFPLQYGFLAMERTRPIFSGYIFATLFTLISSYPLIWLFGLGGAIGGMIVSQAIILANLVLRYRASQDGSSDGEMQNRSQSGPHAADTWMER